jgi:hypothetical protein
MTDMRRSSGCAGRGKPGSARRGLLGQPQGAKLDPHGAYLQGLIDADRDITLAEMQASCLRSAA